MPLDIVARQAYEQRFIQRDKISELAKTNAWKKVRICYPKTASRLEHKAETVDYFLGVIQWVVANNRMITSGHMKQINIDFPNDPDTY